jgi:hypothetical protein
MGTLGVLLALVAGLLTPGAAAPATGQDQGPAQDQYMAILWVEETTTDDVGVSSTSWQLVANDQVAEVDVDVLDGTIQGLPVCGTWQVDVYRYSRGPAINAVNAMLAAGQIDDPDNAARWLAPDDGATKTGTHTCPEPEPEETEGPADETPAPVEAAPAATAAVVQPAFTG